MYTHDAVSKIGPDNWHIGGYVLVRWWGAGAAGGGGPVDDRGSAVQPRGGPEQRGDQERPARRAGGRDLLLPERSGAHLHPLSQARHLRCQGPPGGASEAISV
eukprot:1192905-Prorocentrum_minimum.AAC.2